jgi:preprotein translocase subunit SecG
MVTFLTVVYVFVCLFLILVVLLQAGRGGGMGSAFGGGSSQTVFGGAGATNFLQKLTVASAALFMILSATLAYLSSSTDKSLERAAEAIRLRDEARGLAGAVEPEAAEGAASLPEEASPDAPEAVEGAAFPGVLDDEAIDGAGDDVDGADADDALVD